MAWQLLNVTKSNFDLTDFVPAESLAFTHSAYGEISRLAFRVEDDAGTIDLDPEDELVLTDGGVKSFAGYLRQLNQTDDGRSSARVFDCVAQDYTSALSDDVVDAAFFRDGNESDKSLITALFSAFGTRGIVVGTEVQTLRATMGVGQEFFGLNLHQSMTEIEKIVGASFFVDFDKKLHHYTSESNAAPFNLSDDPNYSTTFEYEAFALPIDSVETVNAVFVIGDGISGWRTKGGVAIATLRSGGTLRAKTIRNDEIKTQAQLNAAGDAELAANSDPRQPGSLVVYRAGLRAGTTVQVTHVGHGLTAVTYRIQSIEARGQTRDRVAYTIRFGGRPVTLGEVLGRTVGEVGRLAGTLSDVQTKLADLSIGGGNLVPNSSFEDGTAWSVGAQWAIGVDPTPNPAYAGTKVGRAVLAAQTAGNLVTPAIIVDRTDDYWISIFRFIRSRTSGTFRIYVEELDAGNTVLRTTLANFTAVDTDWTRQAWHFGPAPSADVIGWMPATAKVRLGVSSAGAAATLSVDVDGAQVERSKILTAYAPSPTDLLTAPITTTQIADNAITTPKLATNSVVAGKIAAGTIGTNELAALAVTADKIAAGAVHVGNFIGEPGNSCPNPGFENLGSTVIGTAGAEIPGWVSVPPTATVINTASHTGANALAINMPTPVGASNIYVFSEFVPVRAGARYLVSQWSRGLSTNAGVATVAITINWYDAAFAVIGSDAPVASRNAGASTVWTKAGPSVVVAPAGAVYAKVIPYQLLAGAAAGDRVIVDDLEFYVADYDVNAANGNVVIDPSGVTILNGALVVSNAGATVIIDGTSNMFKIQGEIRSPALSWPAVNTETNATTINFGGGVLSVLPTVIPILTRSDTGKTQGEIVDYDPVTGVANTYAKAHYDLNAGSCRMNVVRGCPQTVPSGSIDFHGFVLKEAAL